MVIGKKLNIGSAFIISWILIVSLHSTNGVQYLGKFIGKLSELHHAVNGEVYAVDARTLHIKGFTYDGQGPSAYFYVGDTKVPSSAGFRLRDENGRPDPLRRYNGESVTLTLPEGRTLGNTRWISVWCDEFSVNFGDVKIPPNFDYPRPQKIDPLNGVHGISSDEIVIVDAQTLLIPHLSYDGEAPDAKFWAGRGPKPSPQGIRIPDENGKEVPLRKYDRKTVVLTLPGELTVFDIGHFGIWCERFTVDFGHVQIPSTINIPPSLKMLGVSPQSKLNCEILLDERAFEVRWAIAGESIVLQLVAKLDDGEYMSFGLSGEDHASVMIGGDVVVAWVNKETLKGYADDYYLGDKSQCAGYTGSCPDQLLQDGADAVRVLNAALVNGYSIVTYQRTLRPHDRFDRQIYINQSQPIIWAIGPLNQRNQVSYHSKYAKGNHFIDFGRPPKWNCPNPESEQSRSPRPKKQKEIPQEVQPQTQSPQRHEQQQQPKVAEQSETTVLPTPRKQNRRRGEARRRVVNNENQNQDGEKINPASSTTSKQLVDPVGRGSEREYQTSQRPRQNRRRNNGDRGEGRNNNGARNDRRNNNGNNRNELRNNGGIRNDERSHPKNEYIEKQAVTEVEERPFQSGETIGKITPWHIPPIQCYEPEDGVFYAQMGPAGGKKGYPGITGQVSWGIAWYINGLLIPEINVIRGKTYTFVAEGGDDESIPAKYHPFYITDDPVGGYHYKTPEERERVHIFAGAVQLEDGSVKPTGTGRLCHWTYRGDLEADDYPSFGAYQRNLELKCEQGDPGIVQWTPNKMTPDTVYYQCFTHRYLGWKINVLDSCDELTQGSEFRPSVVLPPKDFKETYDDDLETDASYRVATVVKLPSGSKTEVDIAKINNDLLNNSNLTDVSIEKVPAINTTMYVSHPNILTSEVIMKPLFYAASENPDHPSSKSHRPIILRASAKPPNKLKSNFRIDNLANNPRRHQLINLKNNIESDILIPLKIRSNFIRQRNPLQYRKRSHVVKKVIKHPKDSEMAEQRQLRRGQKRPLLNANQLRIKSIPEDKLNLYKIFSKQKKEPVVEISPLQASTEKALGLNQDSLFLQSKYKKIQEETKTKKLEPTIEATENQDQFRFVNFLPTTSQEPSTLLEFAVNTGFNPRSIVFERGFTPIMTERSKTISTFGPEIENESELGMLDVPAAAVANLTHKNFLNHRYDDIKDEDNSKPYEIRKKRQKSNLSQYLPYENDNQKTYLPPNSDRRADSSQNPTVFITYDGKKIPGSSLTAALDTQRTILNDRNPKAAELVRSKPQFTAFKGELPPLDPKTISSFGAVTQQASLNRGLETPKIPNSRDSNNGVTKLRLVPRNKREAHHTPEHTAEQMAAQNSTHDHHQSSGVVKLYNGHILVIVSLLIFAISYQSFL